MSSLQYPIGRYQSYDFVTLEQRTEWIEEMSGSPERLVEAVQGLDEQQLSTSYRPDGWTVRQVVHHLADSHVNGYVRFRLALTEDNPIIKPFDEAAWAELPDSETTPIVTSLGLYGSVSDRWVQLLNGMDEPDFQRTFVHPVSGQWTLLNALGLNVWHARHHIAHITTLRERMGW